jgi:hypothetical protein
LLSIEMNSSCSRLDKECAATGAPAIGEAIVPAVPEEFSTPTIPEDATILPFASETPESHREQP